MVIRKVHPYWDYGLPAGHKGWFRVTLKWLYHHMKISVTDKDVHF